MKVPTPAYRCALTRLQPDPRPDPEQIKREGWRDQQILVISPDDARRILEAKKRAEAGRCAPASGLFLVCVFY